MYGECEFWFASIKVRDQETRLERTFRVHSVDSRYSQSPDSLSWVLYSTSEVVQTTIDSGSGIGSTQVSPTFISNREQRLIHGVRPICSSN